MIKTETPGRVATIELARPDKKNAHCRDVRRD